MTTIVTINSNDQITNSRADINTNFANLNSDKIETSYLDTDTALAANSDTKIPSQKAVKAYIDTSGGANASTTVRGIVEEATSAEMIAGAGTGGTGARLFISPTLVAETGADKIVKTKSTGLLDPAVLPTGSIKSGAVTKDISSTTSTTIAHGLGATPTLVKVTGTFSSDSDDTISYATTVYSASTQSSASFVKNGTIESSGASFIFYKTTGAYSTGAITVDSTNITIAWSKTSTPTGDINLIWEAYR